MSELLQRIAGLSPEKRQRVLSRLTEIQNTAPANLADQGLVTGDVPLLPAQRRLLDSMAEYHINYHHFNIASFFLLEQPLDPELVKRVVQHLLFHHDGLRRRLIKDESGWRQFITDFDEAATVPFSFIDLSGLPEEEHKTALEEKATQLQKSLNLAEGPILQVALFNLGNQRPGRLLIIVHHLATDHFGFRILQEDFLTAYEQLSQGESIKLLPKTTSVKQVAARVLAYAQSPALREELDYWLGLPWAELASPPADYPEGMNSFPMVRSARVVLSPAETMALLGFVRSSGKAQIKDLLIAALAQTLAQWTGSSAVQIVVLFNGRKLIFDDLDLSRTVGWLSLHPSILLRVPPDVSQAGMLETVVEQLRRIPGEGMGFELLRDSCTDTNVVEAFKSFAGPNLVFDYLGQRRTSPVLRPAPESHGPLSPLPNLTIWRSDLHMIIAKIVDDQLEIEWEYSETMFKHSTIEHLIFQILRNLHTLINPGQPVHQEEGRQ